VTNHELSDARVPTNQGADDRRSRRTATVGWSSRRTGSSLGGWDFTTNICSFNRMR